MAQDEIRQLDETVNRIFSSIPKQPFVLDIQSQAPLHVPPLQVEWEYRHSTPFHRDELHLQHLSFKRKLDSSSVISADGRDLIGVSQPRPKKKITLADYQKRKALEVSATDTQMKPSGRNVSRTSSLKDVKSNKLDSKRFAHDATSKAQKEGFWSIRLGESGSTLSESRAQEHKPDSSPIKSLRKTLKAKYETELSHANAAKYGSLEQDGRLRHAFALGVENILYSMHIFTKKRASYHAWTSLYGLLNHLLSQTTAEPHLHGICHTLNAACASQAQVLLIRTASAHIKTQQQIADYVKELQSTQLRACSSSRKVDNFLSKSLLKTKYPETYEVSETFSVMNLSPLSAIRLSISFLKEWAEQNDVAWKANFDESMLD